MNFSLDNSNNKNYTKNKKFGISELTIRNRPLKNGNFWEVKCKFYNKNNNINSYFCQYGFQFQEL